MNKTVSKGTIIGAFIFIAILIVILMFGLRTYNVWHKDMVGKA